MAFGDQTPLGILDQISPQRAYLWGLVLPPAGSSPDLATTVDQLCRKVDFGNGVTMEPNKTKQGSFTTFSSGPVSVAGVTMSFIIPEGRDVVLEYFKKWSELIVNGISQYQPKSFYAFNVQLIQYSTDDQKIAEINVLSAFPVSFGKTAFKHDGEDLVMWNIGLSADRVIFS